MEDRPRSTQSSSEQNKESWWDRRVADFAAIREKASEEIKEFYKKLETTPEAIAREVRNKMGPHEARHYLSRFDKQIQEEQQKVQNEKGVAYGLTGLGITTFATTGVLLKAAEVITNAYQVDLSNVPEGALKLGATLIYAGSLIAVGETGFKAGEVVAQIEGRVKAVRQIRRFLKEKFSTDQEADE